MIDSNVVVKFKKGKIQSIRINLTPVQFIFDQELLHFILSDTKVRQHLTTVHFTNINENNSMQEIFFRRLELTSHHLPSGGSRLKVGMVVITLFLRPKIR
jgi:hypothetical protein